MHSLKVLVTGASGLIGGRFIRHLLESPDVLVKAASRTVRAWPDRVEGCVVDLDRPSTFHDACEGVEAVVNLSSMAERFSALDPHAALRVNAGGTLSLATAASTARVRRFVQVSTYKVYGNNPSGFVTEGTLCKPQSHYAITHRAAEDYATSQHPNTVVFRLANGFGAPVDPAVDCWAIIVNELCRQIAVDGRITIRSSGQTWRNFVPMHDVILALRAAATDLPAGTYNLGWEQSMQLRGVAERVAEVCRGTLGFSAAVVFGPAMDGEETAPLDFRTEKLARAGVTPVASFDEEVSRTLLAAWAAFGPPTRG